MLDLEAIELIKQLKARYFRFMDMGKIEGLMATFSEDAEVDFKSPTYEINHKGYADIREFYESTFSKRKFGMHTGHHPEITVTGDTATGLWYLHDIFVSLDDGVEVEGSALYEDRYIKQGGEWKIVYTGYERLFEKVSMIPEDTHVTGCPIK